MDKAERRRRREEARSRDEARRQVYAAVTAVAARQHGIVSRQQATAAGLTRVLIRRLVESRKWVPVHPGVYRVSGVPETWRGRMIAACLAAGEGSAVSHRSAAALWDLDGFDGNARPVHVTVPANRYRRVKGARVHRSRDWELAGVTEREGIPVTGLARTVLDVAAGERNPQVALRALDAVRRRPHRVPWPELWRCLVLHARRGRPGVRRFREVLERRDGREPTDSEFESLVLDVLIDAGLPAPEPRCWVGRYRLDLAYVAEKVGIECQSRTWHLNEAAFEADAIRENWLAAQGWLIIRVTWDRLTHDPAGVVADVRAALAQRRATAA